MRGSITRRRVLTVAAVNVLAGDLGGGGYRDETGRLVVAVADEAVEAAGGAAEIVTYSTAQLRSVPDALAAKVADVGSWLWSRTTATR